MNSTAPSASEAIQQTHKLDSTYGALERRTAGITWLAWAIAAAGIFMTYNYLGLVLSTTGTGTEWLFAVAWAPWVAIASAATALLWRSVAIATDAPSRLPPARAAAAVVLFVAFVAASILAAPALGLSVVEPGLALFGVGAAMLAIGAAAVFPGGRGSRALWLAGGAALCACAIAGSFVWGGDPALAYAGFAVLSPVAVAGVFVVNGSIVGSRN